MAVKKIIVNGAKGRMGKITCDTIEKHSEFNLVAKAEQGDDLAQLIKQHHADIVVDFTQPKAVFNNINIILDEGASPVVGTSGLLPPQIATLQARCQQLQRGAIIAPNFSLGAILMMKYAQDAAKYFRYAEIIELHHENKLDAPSGTAIKTAELMAPALGTIPHHPDTQETIVGARGALYETIPIHSVRLPGLVAHQEVIFGGRSETLTIKHDSIGREAFMPGVILACLKVTELSELVYGLENLL
ncbi:MAG: 4-hydroxy-tetrahydrodipicolinate reductase [Legionellales bacterium]|nr:4-hydroxy-tetrahydrodipicolinate reductase [Legionellales bacterium]